MKLVLDANVIVAAFASRGLCESILELCLDRHDVVLSEHLLTEIHKNLIKKVKVPKATAGEILELLRDNASIVKPIPLPENACRDPDDIKVLGAALAANADLIVTGDKDLLVLKSFRHISILSPRQFADLIHKS